MKELKITDLIPYENNPRINDQAVDAVAESIKQFGFKVPIIVDENMVIIAGHTRLKAAKKLNLETVPVIIASDLTPDQVKAFRLADNKVGELAEWDFDKLELELADIDLDMSDFGFDEIEEEFEGKTDDDDIPEVEEDPICQKGQIWQLGRHRIMCGDSTNAEDVAKLMDGEKADMVFTSPPYNSGNADFTYDYKAKKEGGFYNNYKDNLTKNDYYHFLISVLTLIKEYIADIHSIFWNVMYNANSRDDYGKIIFSKDNPFKVRETIIWNKLTGFPVAGDNILSRQCELIFLLSNSEKYLSNQHNKTIYWNRWDIGTGNSTQDKLNKHKACFPVALPEKSIIDFSLKDMIILDPFLGSGSTLIAAEKTNRICYGMELDPHYCDVIIKRWEDYTGNKAELQ